jgi:hypothetical protein
LRGGTLWNEGTQQAVPFGMRQLKKFGRKECVWAAE